MQKNWPFFVAGDRSQLRRLNLCFSCFGRAWNSEIKQPKDELACFLISVVRISPSVFELVSAVLRDKQMRKPFNSLNQLSYLPNRYNTILIYRSKKNSISQRQSSQRAPLRNPILKTAGQKIWTIRSSPELHPAPLLPVPLSTRLKRGVLISGNLNEIQI